MKRFQKLVLENYGYTLFLDDLPSAVRLPGFETQYLQNIPLGYVIQTYNPSYFSDGTPMYEIAIFNHLDIKVMVSPSVLTNIGLTNKGNKK